MVIVTDVKQKNKRYLAHELTTKINSVKLYRQTNRIHPLDVICSRLHIVHKTIRPKTPWHNGKVERSHRNDQERFYNYRRQHHFPVSKMSCQCAQRENGYPQVLRGKEIFNMLETLALALYCWLLVVVGKAFFKMAWGFSPRFSLDFSSSCPFLLWLVFSWQQAGLCFLRQRGCLFWPSSFSTVVLSVDKTIPPGTPMAPWGIVMRMLQADCFQEQSNL